MQFSVYNYHSYEAEKILTPRNSSYNIKGVELEINDYCDEVCESLDDMIDQQLLYAPGIKGTCAPNPVVISDDGSVFRELIIKACSNRKLLKTVKMLSDELNSIVDNTPNTSCHIHVNKNYLQTLGVRTFDLFKASEFLAPILYRISERDYDSMSEWAQSYTGDIENINLYKRTSIIDNLNERNNNPGRYYILNTRPGKNSAEFRIFSNNCSFDYETIKLYIETVDLIIEIAEFMIGKSYKEEYENIINKIKTFFTKRNNKKFFIKYNLDEFFLSKEELKERMIEKEKNKLIRKFNTIRTESRYESELNTRIRLIRILRDYQFELPSLELLYDGQDIDRIEAILINDLDTQLRQ